MNPIAINQCANAILSLGASPMMAEHPMEVAEITETAASLLLNFGNITDMRIKSMKISMTKALACDIPVVVDVCGLACSSLRRSFFKDLIKCGNPSVIKGNYSEIIALANDNYKASGVDSAQDMTSADVEAAVCKISSTYTCTAVATGPVDIVAFPTMYSNLSGFNFCSYKEMGDSSIVTVTGGCPKLTCVTGTGCMLGAIIATALAFENSPRAVISACKFFGNCGRLADTGCGNGSFMVNLMDQISERASSLI